jgi:DNA end-binding protein Ku
VRAKIEGRKIVPLPKPKPTKPTSLLEALRESAGASKPPGKSKKRTAHREAPARRKAS